VRTPLLRKEVDDNHIIAQGPKEKILPGKFAQKILAAREEVPKDSMFQVKGASSFAYVCAL
jgi:hypothetical protein